MLSGHDAGFFRHLATWPRTLVSGHFTPPPKSIFGSSLLTSEEMLEADAG